METDTGRWVRNAHCESNEEWAKLRKEWDERDELADALLLENPLAARHLVEHAHLFNSVSAANRWLNRRYEWGKIFLVGKKRRFGQKTGRYEYFFCGRQIGPAREHEFIASDIVANYFQHAEIVRTGVDPVLLPDFTMFIGDVRFNGELDNKGNMSLDRMARRWRKYSEHLRRDPLLVVTTQTETRVNNLLSIAGDIADIICVTTLEWCLANPWGRIWKTVDGRMLKIDKPGD